MRESTETSNADGGLQTTEVLHFSLESEALFYIMLSGMTPSPEDLCKDPGH